MTIAHEYLLRYREQELIREAQRARLVRCMQPSRPWRRRSRRPSPCPPAPPSRRHGGPPSGEPVTTTTDIQQALPPQAVPSIAARAVDVTKTYGRGEAAVRALDGATVAIPAGQFTAVMGPSGSGKSTLVHALAGLDRIDSGHVLLGDTELTTLSERDRTLLRRERLGFVFQAFNLVPSLTAAENIALPLTLAGKKPDPAWLGELVQMLGLTGRLGHRPTQLSGGQQQRVAVGRALIA